MSFSFITAGFGEGFLSKECEVKQNDRIYKWVKANDRVVKCSEV